MSVSEMFSTFLNNLVIKNSETIGSRYGEITSALNKKFRDTDSKTNNTLQVGSFGRNTGINGISDLDMLYIMPKSKWEDYKNNGQSKLLQSTKDAILERYPRTEIKVDRLVVTVTYTDFYIEVQPVFEQDDGSFYYPDTKNGGSWKTTKPKDEMNEISDLDKKKNQNLKKMAKMVRSWKNKHGLEIGGLLIDTLSYNFFKQTDIYDSKSFNYYDELFRDFFFYMSELPRQDRYNAPGSNQHVKVKKQFQKKAKKAFELCKEAIEAKTEKIANDKWRAIFGRTFPITETSVAESFSKSHASWTNTEEFIEDRFPIDIRYNLEIDCEVKQNGFRTHSLRFMISKRMPLLPKKTLKFKVVNINVPEPYKIYWKVLNRGYEAQKRNSIRGQILEDKGNMTKYEPTNFKGNHIVECYAVKSGVIVARDLIDVPIASNG